jgi:hypothetical protein
MAWKLKARHGMAWHGKERKGKARQGKGKEILGNQGKQRQGKARNLSHILFWMINPLGILHVHPWSWLPWNSHMWSGFMHARS